MNNEQFRRLVANNSSSKPGERASPSSRTDAAGAATPRGALEGDQRATKRFKSSAAPKGTKLPAGYQDRTQLRNAQEGKEDDLARRVQALEEMVKLGQMDRATFDRLCRELGVGGDTTTTHLVKGLDWELLKRAKAGEDVSKKAEKPQDEVPEEKEPALTGEEAEEEFDRLMEEKAKEEVTPVLKGQKEKKGNMAPPSPPAKTRNEILKELKESRAAANAPAPKPESVLGSRFKKLGDSKPGKRRFVETDENGRRREVLLITDAQGNTKRKTRWIDKPGEPLKPTAEMPTANEAAKPPEVEVPAQAAAQNATSVPPEDEDEDLDIFPDNDQPASEHEAVPFKPRNWFGTRSPSATDETGGPSISLENDPVLLEAKRRAANLQKSSPSAEESDEDREKALRRQKFFEEVRRRDAMDAADLDFGFGGSRIEDGEEEDNSILLDFDDRGGKKRKRGPKKRKGR
ncbi:hypothetical protein N7468_010050 [Penicillium chermesinum]|uniref:RED-like N-terminal domain-containing protein n=1 Tax=Penicillium chermesinum TaxID=63820 RepID=A0A9W9NBY1_9EURO|nr:uncharacterized protein N7468_010050 [Penicillium chermesinum]KAJ5217042.1 hypothetical protein N7468_010050 [Penicillium chermesinum]